MSILIQVLLLLLVIGQVQEAVGLAAMRVNTETEAQEAVPYYVAAHLVMQDDAFRYATLFNEYTAKKDSMIELPSTEPSTVQDVYFPCAGDYSFWG